MMAQKARRLPDLRPFLGMVRLRLRHLFQCLQDRAARRARRIDRAVRSVSEEVAGAMANSNAYVSLSTTGIAGPGGAVPGKPVGTVCFGWALEHHTHTERLVYSGDRHSIREQTVTHALRGSALSGTGVIEPTPFLREKIRTASKKPIDAVQQDTLHCISIILKIAHYQWNFTRCHATY